MPQADDLFTLTLQGCADDFDRQASAELLLQELRERDDLPFSVHAQSHGMAGSKDAAQAISAGQIVLTLLASGGGVVTLIGAIQSWLLRNQGKKVSLQFGEDKLELTGGSPEHQDQMVRAFLRTVKERKSL